MVLCVVRGLDLHVEEARELFRRGGAASLGDGTRNAVRRSRELGSQIRVPDRREAGRELMQRDAERMRALPRVNLLEVLHSPAWPCLFAAAASVCLDTKPFTLKARRSRLP